MSSGARPLLEAPAEAGLQETRRDRRCAASGREDTATEEELRALIARGEGQRTDYRAAEADPAELARASATLANSGSGTLLGVGNGSG